MLLISLCMIVKNEEKFLARCLDSVQGLVDEIIIIDTGSGDTTKEIAHKYTDQVYDFKWTNDFAAARNESLRYAKGRWILVLDADEYVQATGHIQLREYLKNFKLNKPWGFIVKIMNFTGQGNDETQMSESTGARIFKNNTQIRYTQPLHEQLICSKGEIQYSSLSFSLFHSGYTEEVIQQKNKSQRNMSILKTMKASDHNTSYYHFVLGNGHTTAGEVRLALEAYQTSFETAKSTDTWYHHLLGRLITAEMQLDQHHLAFKHIHTGINLMPQHADYYCLYGVFLDSLGYWNAATDELKKCIQIAEMAEQKNTPYWIVEPTYGKILPYQILGNIYRKKGDLTIAISFWVKTLKLQPKNYQVLQQLIDHLLVTESVDQIVHILKMIYPSDVPMNSVLLFKIALYTGNTELILHYYSYVEKLGIQLGNEDTLLLNLLNKNPETSIGVISEPIPAHVALMAAIIYNNTNLSDLAADDTAACRQLAQQALSSIQNEPMSPQAIEGHEQVLAQALLLMWKYDYQELYFTLLQQMANTRTLNLLASMFYYIGRVDEALDLSSLLLDNHLLEAEGFKTIGQWYINMGELTDGYRFLTASLQSEPSLDLLGRIKEHFASQEDCTIVLKDYFSRFPGLEFLKIN